jgi:hypothetical protein
MITFLCEKDEDFWGLCLFEDFAMLNWFCKFIDLANVFECEASLIVDVFAFFQGCCQRKILVANVILEEYLKIDLRTIFFNICVWQDI